jgi:hypothetical protein
MHECLDCVSQAGWQPIESAPKDGTAVLLLIEGEAIQGHWVTHGNTPSEWKVIRLSSHGCGCCSSRNPNPTHWQPLTLPQRRRSAAR